MIQRILFLLIIVVILAYILQGLFASPNYCFPSEIKSLDASHMLNTYKSEGTISIISHSFLIIENDLLLTLEIRNFGKQVLNPKLRILFNNPHSNDNSTAIIEHTYYLHDCKCLPLRTASPKKLEIRIPFPIESSLQLAMNIQTHMKIIIESDNKILLHENIHLSPNIIFSNTFLAQNDLLNPVRVIIFGEQGSAKTTIINDFLNNLRGIFSKITPPPFGQTIGAGVAKFSITKQFSDNNLESSLVFYETQGSRMGQFNNDFHYFTNFSSLFNYPLNPAERINFVVYTFNSKQFIRTDDKQLILDKDIRDSYCTIARAISRYNEENPANPIQPIILITYANELIGDTKAQSAFIDVVKKDLNEDPVPILVYQTSFPDIKDSEKVYVLQSVSTLVDVMQQYIPNIIQQNEITFLQKLTRVSKYFFSFKIWERVKYFHSLFTWFIGFFAII